MNWWLFALWIIANFVVGVCAGLGAGAWLTLRPRLRRVEDEVTELHAYIDAERMNRGLPPMFARGYGIDIEEPPHFP